MPHYLIDLFLLRQAIKNPIWMDAAAAATVLKCSESKRLLALAIISGGRPVGAPGFGFQFASRLKPVIIIFIIFHKLALFTGHGVESVNLFRRFS